MKGKEERKDEGFVSNCVKEERLQREESESDQSDYDHRLLLLLLLP